MAKKKKDAVEAAVADLDHVVEKSKEKISKGLPPAKGRLAQILASKLMAEIQKEYGASILVRASEYKAMQEYYIPTGNFYLDYALGGGFRVGRVSVSYGPKSSMKTTTYIKAISNAQQMCSNCWTFPDYDGKCACKKFRETIAAFIDVEGTFDLAWARRNGVDTDTLLLSVPDYAEQSLDIADALVRSGKVDIVVLDSIAFLTPEKEIENSVSKETMGVQPRVIGKGVRKFVSGINAVGNQTGRRPTILLTNQLRMKLGVMFGNPETQPGGMAPGFAATTEVKMWPGKYEIDKETARPIYADMNFRIEKNKTGAGAKMEGAYKVVLADTVSNKVGDVLDEEYIVALCEKFGLIEKKGGSWLCLGEDYSAKSHIEKKISQERAFKYKLRGALLEILCGTTTPIDPPGMNPETGELPPDEEQEEMVQAMEEATESVKNLFGKKKGKSEDSSEAGDESPTPSPDDLPTPE